MAKLLPALRRQLERALWHSTCARHRSCIRMQRLFSLRRQGESPSYLPCQSSPHVTDVPYCDITGKVTIDPIIDAAKKATEVIQSFSGCRLS